MLSMQDRGDRAACAGMVAAARRPGCSRLQQGLGGRQRREELHGGMQDRPVVAEVRAVVVCVRGYHGGYAGGQEARRAAGRWGGPGGGRGGTDAEWVYGQSLGLSLLCGGALDHVAPLAGERQLLLLLWRRVSRAWLLLLLLLLCGAGGLQSSKGEA